MSEQESDNPDALGQFMSEMMVASHDLGFFNGWDAAIRAIQWAEQASEIMADTPTASQMIAQSVTIFKSKAHNDSLINMIESYQDLLNNGGKEGETEGQAGSDVPDRL